MPSRRTILSRVGVVLTGVLGFGTAQAGAIKAHASEKHQKVTGQAEDTTASEHATVSVDAERTDPETIVADATVPDGGFIVVSFTEAGPPIASSSYLDPGTHEKVSIARDDNPYVEAGESQRYDVQLARDTNDNQSFDAKTDEYYDGDQSLQAVTLSLTGGCELTVKTSYPDRNSIYRRL